MANTGYYITLPVNISNMHLLQIGVLLYWYNLLWFLNMYVLKYSICFQFSTIILRNLSLLMVDSLRIKKRSTYCTGWCVLCVCSVWLIYVSLSLNFCLFVEEIVLYVVEFLTSEFDWLYSSGSLTCSSVLFHVNW